MRTPSAIVLALLAMQPRLEAEESILAANRIAVGGGKLKAEDARRIAQHWSAAANDEQVAKAAPDANALRAAGIAVRTVKRKKTHGV